MLQKITTTKQEMHNLSSHYNVNNSYVKFDTVVKYMPVIKCTL